MHNQDTKLIITLIRHINEKQNILENQDLIKPTTR